MDHKFCRDNLSAYLDNELPQAEKAALESHLAECPECSKELSELRSLSLLIHKHAVEPVPAGLKAKVFAPEKKPAYAWLKPALAASMAAAGVLLVLNVVKTPESVQAPTAFMSRSPSNMAAASGPEEAPLPPLPGQKLSEPAAGAASVGGLESLDAGAAKDASRPQSSLSLTGAGGGGGGQAMEAHGRISASYKADAFSSDKAGTAAAGTAENAPAAPRPEPARLAAKTSAFGQAKYAPRPKQEIAEAEGALAGQKPSAALRLEAKYKKTFYAPASIAAVRGASAGASLRAGRAVPVEGFILDAYTAADGGSGKKAVSRFKNASVGTASEADRQACGDYAEFVLDDGTYCILPDSAGKEFLVKRFGKEEPGAEKPAKRFWDIFEYGGEKYLLLSVVRNDIPAFEYYLLGPRRIRLQGEIEIGRP